MTEDFMKRVSSEPKLIAGMQNPRFMAALSEMQKDPRAAMAKYKVRCISTLTSDTMPFRRA